jgi:hypothetical protein
MSSITETFFPNLLETLKEDPSAAERLDLECGVCLEKMTVNDEVKIRVTDDEIDVVHGAYILPCGHMFGFSCITQLASRQLRAGADHTCPTCRHRLHYIPCHCPHNLGTLLNVNEAKREEMLTKVEKVKSTWDHCFRCGMEAFSTNLKYRLIASTGIDIGMSGPLFRLAVIRPVVEMVFKKSGEDGEWQIERFCVDGRPYWRADIESDDICRLIDKFVDMLADMHFTNAMEPDESTWTEMHVKVSEAYGCQIGYW